MYHQNWNLGKKIDIFSAPDKGKMNDLGIIFHITPLKCMLWHII